MLNKLSFVLLLFTVVLNSCRQGNSNTEEKSYTKGSVNLVVDETFAPIIEDQLMVFQSAYPNANVQAIYKPENELLNLLIADSAKVAVMSRMLTADEAKFYERKQIKIRVNRFALDGIALITHKNSSDTLVNVQDLLLSMQGKPGNIKQLVFDNPNSSTVRYLKELAGVKQLPSSGIYALKSNPEVIKYVATHTGSIGVIGINWIDQPDTDLAPYVSNLKIMGVKNLPGKPGDDRYYKPTQNDLALGLYPLIRNLYLINCEGGPGPGTGFVTFVASERGQRLILKSGLLPDKIPSREIIIRK